LLSSNGPRTRRCKAIGIAEEEEEEKEEEEKEEMYQKISDLVLYSQCPLLPTHHCHLHHSYLHYFVN
jgi:hypothetical protein